MSFTQPNPSFAEGDELIAFMDELCGAGDPYSFARNLSGRAERWVTVRDLLSDQHVATLDRIGFSPLRKCDGFSPCNLKAHYVLDEDYINNGSAIVIFTLVGSLWTHVVHLKDQNDFTPVEKWLEGQE